MTKCGWRFFTLAFALTSLTGCQIPYLLKNSWHQTRLLKSRVPIKDVLKDEKTDAETKRKLELVREVKRFAEKELGLARTKNYDSYVELNRPYVTWIVRAAPKFELKPYTWWFPIVGKVPYKGYFTKEGANELEKSLKDDGLDTYVRGVSAFSTLGWFSDPVLSSMMRHSDYDLVNLIIHETVHATIFIKDEVDFNERLATFVGNIGTEVFYSKRNDGEEVLKRIQLENQDQKVFSDFITNEIKQLKAFYKANRGTVTSQQKQAQLEEIHTRFQTLVEPRLKTNTFDWFPRAQLNNAIMLSLETYQADLSDFQSIYEKLGRNFTRLIEYCKKLEDIDNPKQALKTDASGQGL